MPFRARVKRDRFWKKAGVFGLWAAAVVGIAAVLYAHSDSSGQIIASEANLTDGTPQLSRKPAECLGSRRTLLFDFHH
jgi:hypothetical protein